jgi:hypothetical protein
MSIIRCHACQADPAARWRQSPMMVFIEPGREGPERYACRTHVSTAKEAELQAREKERNLAPGSFK